MNDIEPVAAPHLTSVVHAAKSFIAAHSDIFPQIALQRRAGMSMTDPDRYTLACGSLAGTPYYAEDFSVLNEDAGWVKPFLDVVEAHSGKRAVRTRVMTMAPNRCLSYHIDPDPLRYHLVVDTHDGAMFIVDDKVYRMPMVGGVYLIHTDKRHTAVNATLSKHRTHIVTCAV